MQGSDCARASCRLGLPAQRAGPTALTNQTTHSAPVATRSTEIGAHATLIVRGVSARLSLQQIIAACISARHRRV